MKTLIIFLILTFFTGIGWCKDTIKIASFNIQVFGRSKANKPEVMKVIADIIKQFDIVAVQEIRDNSGTAIKKLMSMLGVQYHYIISKRLGRTSSKEQYAYIYREGVELLQRPFEHPDTLDLFHRQPFIAHFKKGEFDFMLVTIHIDPDEAEEEIYELNNVVIETIDKFGEPDIIILGDLNADCSYFNESKKGVLNETVYSWLIPDWIDTNLAKSSCTYDRIIITKTQTENDFTGVYGVVYFDMKYNLSYKEAKKISDHYPVWCEFWTNKDKD